MKKSIVVLVLACLSAGCDAVQGDTQSSHTQQYSLFDALRSSQTQQHELPDAPQSSQTQQYELPDAPQSSQTHQYIVHDDDYSYGYDGLGIDSVGYDITGEIGASALPPEINTIYYVGFKDGVDEIFRKTFYGGYYVMWCKRPCVVANYALMSTDGIGLSGTKIAREGSLTANIFSDASNNNLTPFAVTLADNPEQYSIWFTPDYKILRISKSTNIETILSTTNGLKN